LKSYVKEAPALLPALRLFLVHDPYGGDAGPGAAGDVDDVSGRGEEPVANDELERYFTRIDPLTAKARVLPSRKLRIATVVHRILIFIVTSVP
jgi:hypothetical protein